MSKVVAILTSMSSISSTNHMSISNQGKREWLKNSSNNVKKYVNLAKTYFFNEVAMRIYDKKLNLSTPWKGSFQWDYKGIKKPAQY